ncbi:hypothetical protein OG912_19020 [Streptomyces sp. NBC_00464]|uniref:hypothetical protein n=1 Tax=Streptomyces sp. NBC_00464 TaxID=2975751 RepID=UPI002E172CA3
MAGRQEAVDALRRSRAARTCDASAPQVRRHPAVRGVVQRQVERAEDAAEVLLAVVFAVLPASLAMRTRPVEIAGARA